jgi:hypothetical protein
MKLIIHTLGEIIFRMIDGIALGCGLLCNLQQKAAAPFNGDADLDEGLTCTQPRSLQSTISRAKPSRS